MLHERQSSITLHQLRIFSTVARERSFARAAESLYLAQPSVSDQIKLLENLTGLRLFERSRGRSTVDLTEAGRVLLDTCCEIFSALEQGARALEALRSLEGGTVSFGAGISFGGHLLPRVHESFRKANPGITVRLRVGLSEQVLHDLKEHRVDLAVVGCSVELPGVECDLLGHYEVVIVGPPGHRLASGPPAPLRALARERLLLPNHRVAFRRAIDRMAAEAEVVLHIGMEVDNVETKLQAVMDGLGVAPLTYDSVVSAVNAGHLALLRIQGFPLRMPWFLAYRRGELSPAAQRFRTHLLQFLPTLRERAEAPLAH